MADDVTPGAEKKDRVLAADHSAMVARVQGLAGGLGNVVGMSTNPLIQSIYQLIVLAEVQKTAKERAAFTAEMMK